MSRNLKETRQRQLWRHIGVFSKSADSNRGDLSRNRLPPDRCRTKWKWWNIRRLRPLFAIAGDQAIATDPTGFLLRWHHMGTRGGRDVFGDCRRSRRGVFTRRSARSSAGFQLTMMSRSRNANLSAVVSEKFSIATGPVADDSEGFFMLDHNSGLLQCQVIYPRLGQVGANSPSTWPMHWAPAERVAST